MAQRTEGVLLCISPLRQSEEQQPIPTSTGNLARDRAQGTVAARLVLKSVREHLDHDLPIADPAGEQRARPRQSTVLRRSCAIDMGGTGIWPNGKLLRRAHTKISIIGNLGGAAARPFAQISFGIGLQAKGDAAQQKLLVRGFRLFAEQLPVSLLERGDLPL